MHDGDRTVTPAPDSQVLAWSEPAEAVLRALDVARPEGLGPREAERRRREHGPNRLREPERTSTWRVLVDQLASGIMALLGAAAAAALVLGHWIDGVAILVAIVINALIGFITELGARRSMEALLRMDRVIARVRRGRGVREVGAHELVPGDIVLLEGGDVVTADMRLVEASRLQVNESALTGESVPVVKHTGPVDGDRPLAERDNMVFKGTSVSHGSGEGVVVATGMDTELGAVSSLVQQTETRAAPIEERLDRLGRRLIGAVLGLAGLVALSGALAGRELFLMIETGIALAVAAVPEGLPIVATLALARGMRRMMRRNALVRQLGAVQTLGATTVIFADKTGTLTANEMVVRRLLTAGAELERDGDGQLRADGDPVEPDPDRLHALGPLLEVAALCSNADLGEDGGQAVGDPMEVALLRAAAAAGAGRERLLETMPELREVAFDQQARMMATYHRAGQGALVAVKGAPDAVLDACSRVLCPGGEQELTDGDRRRWLEHNERLAADGLRVLALARREVDDADAPPYQELCLLGLVGLMDPPRDDVPDAIAACRRAGVEVVMATGDQPRTALAVAELVGIEQGSADGAVLHGAELDRVADEELRRARVFARVTPEQKLRLVQSYQDQAHIVAMTGDGVNDAPALKMADIGVAMGQRGTQVAKEAADVVLQDDALPTIVTAVEYGRSIFDNIRKFVIYLLSGNAGEILIVGLAALAGAPLPLLPLQVLYLNAINDVFPALALGVGQANPATMERPPRDAGEAIITRRGWWVIALYGALIAAPVLGVFALALGPLRMSTTEAVSVSFLGLALGRLWHVFNMRVPGTAIVRNEVTRNPLVWGALVLSAGLITIAVYTPGLDTVLGLTHPGAVGWTLALAASVVPLVVGQIALGLLGRRGRGRAGGDR